MTATIRIVNTSTKHKTTPEVLALIGEGLRIGQRDLARDWGQKVHAVSFAASQQGWHIALIDNADVAGALGYHDVDPQGRPYSRVFLDPIFDNGGVWFRTEVADGGSSVLETADHEAKEMALDPPANEWANDAAGKLYALEGCDPVEAWAYKAHLRPGSPELALSDHILPAWLNPWSPGPYDYLGRLTEPFEIGDGGYAIVQGASAITEEYGRRGSIYTRMHVLGVDGGRQPMSVGSRRLARARWLAA